MKMLVIAAALLIASPALAQHWHGSDGGYDGGGWHGSGHGWHGGGGHHGGYGGGDGWHSRHGYHSDWLAPNRCWVVYPFGERRWVCDSEE